MSYNAKYALIAVSSLLLIGAAIVFIIFLVVPSVGTLMNLKIERSAKELEKSTRQNLIDRVRDLSKQYQNLDKGLKDKIGYAMPQDENLSELLIQLETMAADSDLRLEAADFSPQQPARGASSLKYKTVSANLAFTGTYPDFQHWLQLVESNVRLMDVKSIEFGASASTANTFVARVNFLIYYQETSGAATSSASSI